MDIYTKKLYRIGEVAAMLALPISTIKYWTDTFDEIRPVAIGTGRQKKYRPEDIEAIKFVRYLMHDKQMQIEGAKAQIKRSKVPYQGFRCDSAEDAVSLLAKVGEMVRDNPRAVNAVESVVDWLRQSHTICDTAGPVDI